MPLLCLAVNEGRLTMDRVIELVADNPRRIWDIECPPETYTVVDTSAEYTIERDNLHTLCGWSPFEGMNVCGRVTAVVIRGQQVYDGENILIEAGFGQNLYA